jgi:hypothetical protein
MAKSKLKAAKKRANNGKKRVRKDVFSAQTDQSNASYFGRIVEGTHKIYMLNTTSHVKKDYNDKWRHCWQVYNRDTMIPAVSIRSAKAYRLALLWSISGPNEFLRTKKKAALKAALPSINGKQGEHCRHRCGVEWCCNPGHIVVGSRVANEIDKHFHFFLNHPKQVVREKFRTEFKDLCREERLF